MLFASIIGQSIIIIIVEYSLIFIMCNVYHSLISLFTMCITDLCMLYVNVLFNFCSHSYMTLYVLS